MLWPNKYKIINLTNKTKIISASLLVFPSTPCELSILQVTGPSNEVSSCPVDLEFQVNFPPLIPVLGCIHLGEADPKPMVHVSKERAM